MSSRSKKKQLWREEKERQYQIKIQFYDNVLHNLEEIKKAKEEGRGMETIEWAKWIDESIKELDKNTIGKLCDQ